MPERLLSFIEGCVLLPVAKVGWARTGGVQGILALEQSNHEDRETRKKEPMYLQSREELVCSPSHPTISNSQVNHRVTDHLSERCGQSGEWWNKIRSERPWPRTSIRNLGTCEKLNVVGQRLAEDFPSKKIKENVNVRMLLGTVHKERKRKI